MSLPHDVYERLAAAECRLLQFLSDKNDLDSAFYAEASWGNAFAGLIFVRRSSESLAVDAVNAFERLKRQNRKHKNFPWEFVVYALQKVRKKNNELVYSTGIELNRKKGTRMVNWQLLASINGLFDGGRIRKKIQISKAKLLLKIFQKHTGEIKDELCTRSLQYHHFSAFLVSEMLSFDPNDELLQRCFLLAADYSEGCVLPNGVCCYIGRGQEQLFGYGSILIVLHRAYRLNRNPKYIEKFRLVFDRLVSFQRHDGSFPLVLRTREPELPNVAWSHRAPGWYGYNALADYLPFLAYCLGVVLEESRVHGGNTSK